MSKTPRTINTKNLIEILKMSQEDVKGYVYLELKRLGYKPIYADGFVYAEGDIPIAMVAHMDTVHQEPKYIQYKKGVMTAKTGLGADDRAGIYSILHLARLGYKPTIIFTEDEEIGCVGADKFAKTGILLDNVNYMIELDRRGHNDAVFYDCANDDFTDYITSFGFKEQWGSFSDICSIAPPQGICAVNLSIGYYNEHTNREKLVISDMARTILIVEKMLLDAPTEVFVYEEMKYSRAYGSSTSADKYMASYGYVWSKSEKQYVKEEPVNDGNYPIMMEDAWLVMSNGDLIDLDDHSTAFYIDTDDTIRDCNWQIVDAYPVDYNYIPLGYEFFKSIMERRVF